MSNALVAYSDIEKMAAAIAASKLFGMQTTEQALALMIVAQAENRHPGSVAAEYHIIQGRPALKADAMLARFQQAGGCVEWVDYTDTKVSAKFSHSVNAPSPVLIEWTLEQAKKAGLTGKDNWTKYPRQMLRARVVSEGVRTVYPAVCVGVYTPEEVQDFEPAAATRTRGARAKNMGNVETVPDESSGGTGSSPDPTSATDAGPAAGAPTTRTATLKALCAQAYSDGAAAEIKLLDKAGVQSAEEMSDEDWSAACAMLNRRISDKARAR